MLLLPKSKSSGNSLSTLIKAFWHVLKEHNKRHPLRSMSSLFWNWFNWILYAWLFSGVTYSLCSLSLNLLLSSWHSLVWELLDMNSSVREYSRESWKKTWNCIAISLLYDIFLSEAEYSVYAYKYTYIYTLQKFGVGKICIFNFFDALKDISYSSNLPLFVQ